MNIESKIWKFSNTGTKLHAFDNGVALCRTSIRRSTSDAGIDYCEARNGYNLCAICERKFNGILGRIEASMQPSTGEGDYLPPAETAPVAQVTTTVKATITPEVIKALAFLRGLTHSIEVQFAVCELDNAGIFAPIDEATGYDVDPGQ